MMKKAVLLLTLFVSPPLSALETGLSEGQLFPDLVLSSLEDGKPQSVSSFRGKKLLLHIFASW